MCRTDYEVFSTTGKGGDSQAIMKFPLENKIDSVVLSRAFLTSSCDGVEKEKGYDPCMRKEWRCPTSEERD